MVSDSPTSHRLNGTMPAAYARRIEQRCAERGVGESEAIRQFMDEAQARSFSTVQNAMRGQLDIIKMVHGTLKLRVSRADQDARADLAAMEQAINSLNALISTAGGL